MIKDKYQIKNGFDISIVVILVVFMILGYYENFESVDDYEYNKLK